MQTYSELASSLGCSDCECYFNSASSLLQHFAQHVSQEARKHVHSHSSTVTAIPHLQKKKKKAETILEKVLKRNSALQLLNSGKQSEAGPSAETSQVISLSSYLPYPNIPSPEEVRQCDDYPGRTNISKVEVTETVTSGALLNARDQEIENIKVSSLNSSSISSVNGVPLVKCDLQKRLENCITKLATKKGNSYKSINSNKDSIMLNESNTKKDVQNKNNDDLKEIFKSCEDFSSSTEKSEQYGEMTVDEHYFNPLKYCSVTIEEKQENNDLSSASSTDKEKEWEDSKAKTPRSSSSRKQKSPKKVRYLENGELEESNAESLRNLKASSQTKKKYPCNICSRVFGWSTDLKRHILTHTGERPFKCSVCSAAFTRNFLLQKHLAKNHNSCTITVLPASPCKEEDPYGIRTATEDISKTVPMGIEMKHCSDNSDKKCNLEKRHNSLEIQLECPMENVIKWDNSCILEKTNDYRCNRIPYEIFSQEALNIL